MATITWPANIHVGSADYGIAFDVQINVMRSGLIYTHGLPGARWTATLTFDNDHEDEQRPRVEALLLSLRGGANRLAMPHFGRPIPRGALRGSPTVGATTTPGAGTIALANCNGGLLAGDIIGVGGVWYMVEENVNPSGGNMTVKVSPAVRAAVSSGSPVTWNRPTSLWIPKNATMGPFPFRPAKFRPAFSVEFVEAA